MLGHKTHRASASTYLSHTCVCVESALPWPVINLPPAVSRPFPSLSRLTFPSLLPPPTHTNTSPPPTHTCRLCASRAPPRCTVSLRGRSMHSLRTRAAGTHPSQPTTGEGGQRVDRRAALRTVLEGEGEGGGGRGGTLDMADVSTSTKRQHAELGLQPEETASSFVSCAAAAACSPSLPPATTLTLSMTACLLASPCFCFPPTTPHSCLSASSLPPPPRARDCPPPLTGPSSSSAPPT